MAGLEVVSEKLLSARKDSVLEPFLYGLSEEIELNSGHRNHLGEIV